MDFPAWLPGYIDLPYGNKGRGPSHFDCWGIVRKVLAEQFDVEVPSYADDYLSSNDKSSVKEIIERERGAWRPIDAAAATPGDVVILKLLGKPCHCGIVVAPGWMLHTLIGTYSVRERMDSLRWSGRIEGLYRHDRLA